MVSPQHSTETDSAHNADNSSLIAELLKAHDCPDLATLTNQTCQALEEGRMLTAPRDRNLISSLLGLEGQTSEHVNDTLRNVLVMHTSQAETIADIYMAARDDAPTSITRYLTAYALASVLADHPVTQRACRHLLCRVIVHRRSSGVDALLCDLFRPTAILHGTSVNPTIRRRAAVALTDVYPLIDEDDPTLLTAQSRLIVGWLADDHPAVRAAAVRGVCRALNVYYEAIPAATSSTILAALARLSSDAATPVRGAVLTGVAALLDNPLAIPALKSHLPTMLTRIRDGAAGIRRRAVRLALEVSHMHSISLFATVPLEDLIIVHAAFPTTEMCDLLTPTVMPDKSSEIYTVATELLARPDVVLGLCHVYRARAAVDPQAGIKFAAVLVTLLKNTANEAEPRLDPDTPALPGVLTAVDATWAGLVSAGGDPRDDALTTVRAQMGTVMSEAALLQIVGLADGLEGELREAALPRALQLFSHLQTATRRAVAAVESISPRTPAISYHIGRCLAQWGVGEPDWTDPHHVYGMVCRGAGLGMMDSASLTESPAEWSVVLCEAATLTIPSPEADELITRCPDPAILAHCAARWITQGRVDLGTAPLPTVETIALAVVHSLHSPLEVTVGDVTLTATPNPVRRAARALAEVPADIAPEVVRAFGAVDRTKAIDAVFSGLVEVFTRVGSVTADDIPDEYIEVLQPGVQEALGLTDMVRTPVTPIVA